MLYYDECAVCTHCLLFLSHSFPPTTPVRKGDAETFVSMSQIDWNAQVAKATGKTSVQKKKKNERSVEDRIAALRSQENGKSEEAAVDDRIASLRAQVVENAAESFVDDRIAVLRAQDVEFELDSTVDNKFSALRRENEMQEEENDSVKDRIAALRAERDNETEQMKADASVQGRINALRDETVAAGAVDGPAEAARNEEMPPCSANLHANKDAPRNEEPPPAYYPLPDDTDEGQGVVAPYPSDLDYPVCDVYPVDDRDATSPFSYVVAPYPTEEGVTGSAAAYPDDDAVQEPPTKKFKADKEVIGLVPTNLQKRRANKKTVAAPTVPNVWTSNATCQNVKAESKLAKAQSVADDYEDFMKDIGELK